MKTALVHSDDVAPLRLRRRSIRSAWSASGYVAPHGGLRPHGAAGPRCIAPTPRPRPRSRAITIRGLHRDAEGLQRRRAPARGRLLRARPRRQPRLPRRVGLRAPRGGRLAARGRPDRARARSIASSTSRAGCTTRCDQRASGFCYVNDAVLAIMRLRERGLRVAYVDIDAHHGDGVQAAFYRDPNVLTISTHERGERLFPGTGFVRRSGRARASATRSTCRSRRTRTPRVYLPAFEDGGAAAARTRSAGRRRAQLGMDAHRTDPLTHLAARHPGLRAARSRRIVGAVAPAPRAGRRRLRPPERRARLDGGVGGDQRRRAARTICPRRTRRTPAPPASASTHLCRRARPRSPRSIQAAVRDYVSQSGVRRAGDDLPASRPMSSLEHRRAPDSIRTPQAPCVGCLITFEGVEGSGKTTQMARLGRWLKERGYRVELTREPDGTALGAGVRRLFERAPAARSRGVPLPRRAPSARRGEDPALAHARAHRPVRSLHRRHRRLSGLRGAASIPRRSAS